MRETPVSGNIASFSGDFLLVEQITFQMIYPEESGVFEKDEGRYLIVKKKTCDVPIVVIVMGSGFSSLGGKICKKNIF
jgi:hypothetical protein